LKDDGPILHRRHAIEIVVRAELDQLTREARESLLSDGWTISEGAPEYAELSDEVKAELAERDGPQDPDDARYVPLLLAGLRRPFLGVTNRYIEERLAELGRPDARVDGPVETLAACPCCGYRSLEERGNYEICGVCFWEDDGSNDEMRYSGPNHMTLGEARANFAALGAVRDTAKRFVLPDGPKRYVQSSSDR
jgi:hypothetical protein